MRLIGLLILGFFPCCLQAQLREFIISEMPRPEVAVVQANTQFPDDALVLIYSAIENLEIRSSLGAIDKVSFNSSASRYEVLVKPIKQMLFAAKAGFIEAKITTLNPNPKDVFYFKVEALEKVAPVEKNPGILKINSIPVGADIFMNGVQILNKTPFIGNATPGLIKVKIRKKKFEDVDTSLVLRSDDSTRLDVNLKPINLWLNVNSFPEGALVNIDGKEIGKTPVSKEIEFSKSSESKTINLQLTAQGCEPHNQQIQLSPSSNPKDVDIKLSRLKGKFNISSDPPGADVFINNVFKGNTPLVSTLDYGTYEVFVSMDGYAASAKRQLIIENDFTNDMDFYLIEKGMAEAQKDSAIEYYGSEFKLNSMRWMGTNLNTEYFQNGVLIQEAVDAEEWKRANELEQPAWCYYNNDFNNGTVMGKLYNWYAVSDPRGICPVGWHLPNDEEWDELVEYYGGPKNAGAKLKGKNGWKNNNNELNSAKFNAFPAGKRSPKGTFEDLNEIGYWWTERALQNDAFVRRIDYNFKDVLMMNYSKKSGFSVRCVHN